MFAVGDFGAAVAFERDGPVHVRDMRRRGEVCWLGRPARLQAVQEQRRQEQREESKKTLDARG